MIAKTNVMPPALDPSHIVLPSAKQARELEATLMFSRATIRIVYVGATAIGVGLIFWAMLSRTALLTPVDPNLRAGMIGLGVFLDVLVAVIEREAWLLGFGGRRAPKGIFVAVAVAMAMLVGASGFGGDFLAKKLWEWQAFHGLNSTGVGRVFAIVARSSGRSGSSLELHDRCDDRGNSRRRPADAVGGVWTSRSAAGKAASFERPSPGRIERFGRGLMCKATTLP